VLFAELRKIDPEAAAKEPREPEDNAPFPHGGIVMYCTPWCGDCKRARAWLAENNLPYTEVDISRSNRAANQVRAWANGNQTTPTFEIDGTVIVDFNVQRLKEVLKI
jgi:mycoredoxin